jgi:carboxypeptidase PM20D1
MKKIAAFAGGGLALLVIVIAARTMMIGAAPAAGISAPAPLAAGREAAAQRLAAAIRFETISWNEERAPDAAAFAGFAAFLEESYPAAHHAMTREVVGGHSLLYRWAGARSDEKPIGLIAHIDVVPVEAGTEAGWTHPAFAGTVADGAVWGRGALDNKGQLIAIMEAAERLASARFVPSRDIYFLFGHDEELGGFSGAGEIAALLKQRGVHFAWTLDEGSGLVEGIIPGVARPVALISTAEKGSTTLRISAHADGGHSSAPGKDTAVSLVARAVVKVTDNPYPLEIDESMVAFLHAIAGEMSLAPRAVLANLWLTGPLVKSGLAGDPTTAAALHTTTAATIIDGGAKVNILPQRASALVNYRIHPRDTAASVLERAIRLVDDERVTVEAVGAREASPQASTKSAGYHAIEDATAAIFGAIPTAPFLTLQGTDSRHYTDLADDNYRFTPFIYHSDDLKRIHGTDERAMIEDLARGVAWYEELLRRAAS